MAQAADAGLTLAWEAAAGHADPADIEQTAGRIVRLMEATPKDRYGLNTFAVEALNITLFALGAASKSTPTDEAQGANQVAIDLVGEVDFLLTDEPVPNELLIERVEDEERPPGPLMMNEIDAQWTSISLLDKRDHPDAQALEAVRRLSEIRAAELAAIMPEFALRWREEAARS